MDALLERIPSRLLAEWMAYYTIEPFGEERADLRSASICKVIADAYTPRGRRRARLEDFVPRFGGPKSQAWQQQLELVEIANAAFGGRDLRGKQAWQTL